MLGTLTPLGTSRNPNATALRSSYRLRNYPVNGSEIVLRDFASSYSIDLSDKSGGSFAYTLNTSQVHQGRHEVLNFEIVLATPAVGSVAVSFPFVDKWVDFGGLWRIQPGRIYFISVFRIGTGEYIGAVTGESKPITKRGIMGKKRIVDPALETGTILLEDNCLTYEETVEGESATFDFVTDYLANQKDVLCFDLVLNIESDNPSITFPVSKWFDFCYPARGFKRGEKHSLTFLSLDGGETWVGRWNNYL
ncbi:MAG: hypothetical protein K6E55_10720 [Thermoguttaceae bacterium]|nr:hypothetical protein [Thermoguttaceae bacterium]